MVIELTYCVRIDDLVLRVYVDLAALELPRLDCQQQQVQLAVANLGSLQKKHTYATLVHFRGNMCFGPPNVVEGPSAVVVVGQLVRQML